MLYAKRTNENVLTPRPYQQAAHDAVVSHWRKSTAPVVIDAATGAGKSLIVAMLARTLHGLSGGKRVLCLAPSKELIEQNVAKYRALGERCSVYSASIGKSLREQVVFATEGTFKKVAARLGSEFAGVIVDECHRITPTIQRIISDIRTSAPNLRVCGLSATPYRLGSGYIYGITPEGVAVSASRARAPYFARCVYRITARELIAGGYLTPLEAGAINATGYDTAGLELLPTGKYSAESVRRAFEGWGRKTAGIVADVVAQTQDATGVMIFAATVKHAHEVMASLHPGNARLITGTTPRTERAATLEAFMRGDFLYLVNVAVLTTGFDAANVSHIAILRATESVSLLQQIMGRGMRLHPGKDRCVVLDYAGNIERHMPDGDLYAPEIVASATGGGGDLITCRCEACNGENEFAARPNEDGFGIDQWGYFLLPTGQRYEVEINDRMVPMPAHFGRRCGHYDARGEQCTYRWTAKTCATCGQDNDIAARYCASCKAEMVDPNKKLIADFKARKKDPTQWQCDAVVSVDYRHGVSRSGRAMTTATVTTSARKFVVYLHDGTRKQAALLDAWKVVTDGFTRPPASITYRKDGDFWAVAKFGGVTDEERLQAAQRARRANSVRAVVPAPIPERADHRDPERRCA